MTKPQTKIIKFDHYILCREVHISNEREAEIEESKIHQLGDKSARDIRKAWRQEKSVYVVHVVCVCGGGSI